MGQLEGAMNELEWKLVEANRESMHWKYVASYLASCHAATLEGLPKSAPKSSRRRHISICEKAAAYLRGKESPPHLGQSKESRIEWEIKRCEEAVQKHAAPSP